MLPAWHYPITLLFFIYVISYIINLLRFAISNHNYFSLIFPLILYVYLLMFGLLKKIIRAYNIYICPHY
jgi:hypothetical protein